MRVQNLLLVTVFVAGFSGYSYAKEKAEKTPVESMESQQVSDFEDIDLTALLKQDVTGASRYTQTVSDIPAPVIVVTADQIKARGYRDLKDIFYDLPGFDVSGNVQGEVRTLVIARGVLGNQKLLVLQDGQRLNPITGERFVFGNNVPIHHAKRIEVIYGPAAAVYGPDAYAGVVNIITKDGKDINGFEVSLGAGLLSMNKEAWATDDSFIFGKSFGEDIDLMLSARVYQSDNGPDIVDEYEELKPINYYNEYGDFEHAEPIVNYDVYGKLKLKNFTIGARFSDAMETNGPTTIPDQYLYTKEFVWRQKLHHVFSTYQLKYDKFESNTILRFQHYEIDPMSNFHLAQNIQTDPNILAWDGQEIKMPVDSLREYKYALTQSVRLEEQFTWNPLESIIIGGGALVERVHSFPKTKNIREGRFNPGNLSIDMSEFIDPATGQVLGVTEDTGWGIRPYTNAGAHAQVEYVVPEKLNVSLGGRYDYNTIYGHTVNPRLGAVYRPLKTSLVRLSLGTAYIQPSGYYVWENWANPFAMHIPNKDLDPERLYHVNLGFQHNITKHFKAALDGHLQIMNDLIRPVPTDYVYNPFLIIPEDSAYTEINANQGTMYTYGGELKLDYIKNNVHIYGSYAYLDGHEKDSEVPVNKISNHKVLLGGDITLFDRLTISPRLRWFSKVVMAQYNSLYVYRQQQAEANGEDPTAVDNSFGDSAGTWLVNLNIRGEIVGGLSAYLSLYNVLNQKHYTAAPYGESVWILPRAPQLLFNFMAGIQYNFQLAE